MDGLPLDSFVTSVCKGYQGEFAALEFGGGLKQGFGFPSEGLWRVYFVRHLYELYHSSLFANNKIDLFAPAGWLVVVDVVKMWRRTSQKFDVHDILESPACVFGQQGVAAIGNETGVYHIALGIAQTYFAFE